MGAVTMNPDGSVTTLISTPAGFQYVTIPAPSPTSGGSAPAAPKSAGTFYKGADGQVYVDGDRGLNAAGQWDANTEQYWSSRGYTMTDPLGLNGDNGLRSTGGGGGSAPVYEDTTASRNATQVSIDNTGTVLQNALTGADTDYKNVTDQYDVEDAENLTKFNTDKEGNEIGRDESTYKGLLAAAKGSRGLYATLASLGALNGTGRTLANRAVSAEANEDIGESEKSFKTNTEALFDARSETEKKEKQRRLDAKKTWETTRQNAEYDHLETNQKLSNEMAGYWQKAGNFAEANNWTNRASSYTPQLAAKTKVIPTEYAKTPLQYSKPELAKYFGGMNSTAVNVASGNPINGALYTSTTPGKKDKELV